MPPMPKWLRRSFVIAILISILVHVLVALFFFFFKLPMPAPAPQQAMEVFDANGKQITDQLLKGNREIPKKAEHIGIEDNAVAEETVARPNPARPTRRASPTPQTAEPRVERAPREPRPKSPSAKLPFNQNSMYAVDPNLFAMKMPVDHSPRRGPEQPAKKHTTIPRTAVSSTMNVESEAYLPEDYYPNYNYGSHTYLNVLRYPDIEYFVRLKRAFKQTWNPFPAIQNYFMNGGEHKKSISVVLAVSVDANGNMPELFVLRGSGSGAYDQEALRTVRANSPFSAPPEKLLKDGLLRMSWTFIVY